MSKIALYLAGGGARGAYQAGALKAIWKMLPTKTLPFSVITGVSVGSINAAILAQHADDFETGVTKLEDLWRNIQCQHIFNASNFELGKSVAKSLVYFIIKHRHSGFLLDTEPLQGFIKKHVKFDKITQHINNKILDTMEVISNCYETQQTISFYQHHSHFIDWHATRHKSQRAELTMSHILASGALPLFFPTVKLNGLHFGDGSMGLVSPLRGALRFNVDKILILGTRQTNLKHSHEKIVHSSDIGFAHILGSILGGLFLDNLDRDIELVNRMNEIANLVSLWNKRRSPWRPIDTLYLRPSHDVAQIAQANYQSMPTLLRYLLNLLGAEKHSGDLLSFLLFEKPFTHSLFDLGYKDTMDRRETLTSFFI